VRSVTALVVTWDSAADIERSLRSLDRVEHADLDVVVLDNASVDDTVARVEAFRAEERRHPLTLIRLTENRGFCGAVNVGVRASHADAVLLVNPDATIEADALTRMLRVLEEHPECGSVQPKLLRLPRAAGAETSDGAGEASAARIVDTTGHVLTRPRLLLNRGSGEADDGRFDAPGEVFGVSGALALHRRAMLEDVARLTGRGREYLTEDLVAYFDDVDLDLRARQRGWTARYEPSAVGHHARAGASKRRRRRVRVLNLANHPLVVIGNEGAGSLLRDAAVVVPLWLVRMVAATVRSPIAMVLAIGRLRLLPAALRRGRLDRGRATVPLAEVIERWCEPLPSGWLTAAARRGLR
jgi:GT2 family glycosyltransferase